ncbi:MAG: hypothetical protein Q9187_004308 [Circinaria calcarea]
MTELVVMETAVSSATPSHVDLSALETTALPSALPAMPAELESPRYARLRYIVFTVYRRLFSMIFFLNLIAFIVVLNRDQIQIDFVNAITANLMISGLARNPLVVNVMLFCLSKIPRSAPLAIRRLVAKGYHYGGFHSGCGVAALVWYIGFTALLTRDFTKSHTHNTKSLPSLVLAYVILLLLLAIVAAAYPRIRLHLHDWFEFVHRFSGWTVVVFFWALLLVFASHAKEVDKETLGQFLAALPAFWMTVIITVSIIHPWLYLRRVRIVPEYISSHAVRLHFRYTTAKVAQTISISNHPLRDWHGFAIFPDADGKGFSALVSKAGDWTADCIAKQPTHMWKRSFPAYNLCLAMNVFQKIVCVATGSGIGPVLSFLADPGRPPMRVIWQTRSPLKTYGQGILDAVAQLDSTTVVIDTNLTGRRDMLPMVWDMVSSFQAEAVVVVSNHYMTRKLVFELEARGIPAYGPIYDS